MAFDSLLVSMADKEKIVNLNKGCLFITQEFCRNWMLKVIKNCNVDSIVRGFDCFKPTKVAYGLDINR